MPTSAIFAILFGCIIVMALLIGLAVASYKNYLKKVESSQRQLTDKELLLCFAKEPDGMLSVQRLVEKTKLTKSEASSRLSYLTHRGVVSKNYTSGMKSIYALVEPIKDKVPPKLSDKLFLTVEDILILFKHHDYKLTVQNICMSTGLPIAIIKREMDYFIKEKVVQKLHPNYQAASPVKTITFLLREPYRSNPDQFLDLEDQMNLDLEKIYQKEIRK